MHVESFTVRPPDELGVLDSASRNALWEGLQDIEGYELFRYCCLRPLKEVTFPNTQPGDIESIETAAINNSCERVVVIDFGTTFTFVYVLSRVKANPESTEGDSSNPASNGTNVMMLANISPVELLNVIKGKSLPDTGTLCIDETLPSKTLTMLPVNIDGEQYTVLITTKTERTHTGFGRGHSDSIVTTGDSGSGSLSSAEIKSLLNQLIRKYPLDENEQKFSKVQFTPEKRFTGAVQQVARAAGLGPQTVADCAGCAGALVVKSLHSALAHSSGTISATTPPNEDGENEEDEETTSSSETNSMNTLGELESKTDDSSYNTSSVCIPPAPSTYIEENVNKSRNVLSIGKLPGRPAFDPPTRLPPPPADADVEVIPHREFQSRRLSIRRPIPQTFV